MTFIYLYGRKDRYCLLNILAWRVNVSLLSKMVSQLEIDMRLTAGLRHHENDLLQNIYYAFTTLGSLHNLPRCHTMFWLSFWRVIFHPRQGHFIKNVWCSSLLFTLGFSETSTGAHDWNPKKTHHGFLIWMAKMVGGNGEEERCSSLHTKQDFQSKWPQRSYHPFISKMGKQFKGEVICTKWWGLLVAVGEPPFRWANPQAQRSPMALPHVVLLFLVGAGHVPLKYT